MPLANIATAPDDTTQKTFDFSHYQDHVEIVRAINSQFNRNLPTYPIHPALEQGDGWKQLHQQFHNDMHAVLGTVGSDLSGGIDLTWYYKNYQEHLAARTKLGI